MLAEQVRAPENARALSDLYSVLESCGLDACAEPPAKVAVIQGGWLSPNSVRSTPGGEPLNTLWGELAWQLAGQAGYEAVGNAARKRSAPAGEELDALFQIAGPCVILLDEIVNYARNDDLDSVSTFLHNLTESVLRQPGTVLVVTLPASETEAGGARGTRALATFENILNRTQSLVQVAQTDPAEACAVVKRRLFQQEFDEDSSEATCQAFSRMYLQYLGILQALEWYIAHPIRGMWSTADEKFTSAVEADETLIEGKESNKHESKTLKFGHGTVGKTAVAGSRQHRTGRLSTEVVESNDKWTLKDLGIRRTELGTTVYTDKAAAYVGLPRPHEAVVHDAAEYVREMVHTTGLESHWAMFKRAIGGTFHHISVKHLPCTRRNLTNDITAA